MKNFQKKYWCWSLLFSFLMVLLDITGTAFSQSSTNYKISNLEIELKRPNASSANYKQIDAIAQASPAFVAQSSNYCSYFGLFDAISSFSVNTLNKTNMAFNDEENEAIPTSFVLFQNYPNPFNPETMIKYQLPNMADVRLTIFNLQGQKVKQLVNETKPAGTYTVHWNGQNELGQLAASGIYFYRIEVKPKDSSQRSFVKTMKMSLMK